MKRGTNDVIRVLEGMLPGEHYMVSVKIWTVATQHGEARQSCGSNAKSLGPVSEGTSIGPKDNSLK